MEITKRGTPRNEREWVGSCRNCNSEATAKESEMTHIRRYVRLGSSSWEVCPVCKAGNEVGYGGMIFYPKQN